MANEAKTSAHVCKEATERITKVVRIVKKSKPAALRGAENSDVVFLTAIDAVTGVPMEKPLTITESRAKMFGLTQLLITEADNAEVVEGRQVVDLTEQGREVLVLELDLLLIPDGEIGDWGYKTKKPVEVDGKQYQTGDIVPYKAVNTLLIQSIIRRCRESDFPCESVERYKNRIKNELKNEDMKHLKERFAMLVGEQFDPLNAEHRAIMIDISRM